MGNIEFFTQEEKELLDKKQQDGEITPEEYERLLSVSKEKIRQEEEISQALDNLEQEALDIETKLQRKIELLQDFIKKNKQSKKVKSKMKKEAKQRGFSWDKISKEVEEKGGWFSFKGLKAGVIALIGGIFSGLFGGIKEKLDSIFGDNGIFSNFNKTIKKAKDTVQNIQDQATEMITSETEGTFENNEYKSKKGKFKIEFNQNGTIKKIIINGQEYHVTGGYKLEKENGKLFLIQDKVVKENKFSLDRLGAYFDKQKGNKDRYKLEDKGTTISSVISTGNFMPRMTNVFPGEIEFIKKGILTIEEKTLKIGDVQIFFEDKIDNNFPITNKKIKEIIIGNEKYKISCSGCGNLSFDIEKDDINLILNYSNALPDLKINILDIPSRIDSSNAVSGTPNKYYLFNQFLTEEEIKKYTSWSGLFTEIMINSKKFYRPDIFLETISQ